MNTDGTGYQELMTFYNPITATAPRGTLLPTVTGDTLLGISVYGPSTYGMLFGFVPALTNVAPINTLNNNTILYPNPNRGVFNIEIASSYTLMANSKVEIYNELGQQIYSEVLSIKHSAFNIEIQGQPAGLYSYKIADESNNLIGSGKFIIEK